MNGICHLSKGPSPFLVKVRWVKYLLPAEFLPGFLKFLHLIMINGKKEILNQIQAHVRDPGPLPDPDPILGHNRIRLMRMAAGGKISDDAGMNGGTEVGLRK